MSIPHVIRFRPNTFGKNATGDRVGFGHLPSNSAIHLNKAFLFLTESYSAFQMFGPSGFLGACSHCHIAETDVLVYCLSKSLRYL